jgi:hypothetical protein
MKPDKKMSFPYRRLKPFPWELMIDVEEPAYRIKTNEEERVLEKEGRGEALTPAEQATMDKLLEDGCFVDPTLKTFTDVLEERGIDIWKDERWVDQALTMTGFPYDHACQMDDDERDSLQGMFENMFYDGIETKWVDEDEIDRTRPYTDGLVEFAPIRMLFVFLMRHELVGLGHLLNCKCAHVDGGLFQWAKHLSFRDGCRTSLLGIAIFDAEAPDAVLMLLKKGANPNDVLNMYPCCVMGGRMGVEAVLDKSNDAPMVCGTKKAITCVKHMLKYGAEPGAASLEIYGEGGEPTLKPALDKAFEAQLQRIRQRFTNVVAIISIVSFWRRVASAPDSRAAQGASKRFKLAATEESNTHSLSGSADASGI